MSERYQFASGVKLLTGSVRRGQKDEERSVGDGAVIPENGRCDDFECEGDAMGLEVGAAFVVVCCAIVVPQAGHVLSEKELPDECDGIVCRVFAVEARSSAPGVRNTKEEGRLKFRDVS